MSVIQIKTIQCPFAPAQQDSDAKHALSGTVYYLDERVQ